MFHSDELAAWFIDHCQLQYVSISVYYVSAECTKEYLRRNTTLLESRLSTDVITAETKHEMQDTEMANFSMLLFMEDICQRNPLAKIKRDDL